MNELTRQIYDYLLAIDDNSTADFLLKNCSIHNQYIDTLFELSGEGQSDLFDVGIFVLPKVYKSLDKKAKLVEKIEEAIRENASADNARIRNIEWLPNVQMNRQVSKKTIDYLKGIITGDSQKTEYLSGPKLVEFFNNFGFSEDDVQGFPSRSLYTENKLKELNKNGKVKDVIEYYFSPINFIENEKLLATLINELNKYLSFDYMSAKIINKKCIVSSKQSTVSINILKAVDHDYIQENIAKCDQKIFDGDYSGAVTNARSLIETILLYIQSELSKENKKFNGDLNSLYKEVAKKLNLSIDKNQKVENSLKKIVSGLFSIVSGIAELGNDLGDRHGKASKKHTTEKHHAVLVVNSSKTFAEFIFSSYEKQNK